jgi:hypothetical protein
MTPISLNNSPTLNLAQKDKLQSQHVTPEVNEAPKTLQVESSKVTISDEGKLLISFSVAMDEEAKTAKLDDPDKPSSVSSFAHGALGLDNPEKEAEEEKDTSYTAGQYLKGALTIGSMLLVVV